MTVLRLEKCGISDASGVAIATMLAAGNCAHLLELALPHNQLGQASAAAFGDLLQLNQTLQYLDLSWNLLQVSSMNSWPHSLCLGLALICCIRAIMCIAGQAVRLVEPPCCLTTRFYSP